MENAQSHVTDDPGMMIQDAKEIDAKTRAAEEIKTLYSKGFEGESSWQPWVPIAVVKNLFIRWPGPEFGALLAGNWDKTDRAYTLHISGMGIFNSKFVLCSANYVILFQKRL